MRSKLVLLVASAWISFVVAEEEDSTNSTQLKFATPCVTPNGDSALCLEIHKCHHFIHDYVITPEHASYDFVQASICGPKTAKIIKVCCGKYKNYPKQNARPTHDPLPKDCGRHKVHILNSRIFGGSEAEIGEFPWMARIIHRSKYGYMHYGCSAVLVHERFVVTAAHCIASKVLEPLGPVFQILLGDHDVDKDIDCTTGQNKICSDKPVYAKAGKAQVYTSYDNSSTDHNNDIAIIPLKESVKFTDFIQPLCLLEKQSSSQSLWLSGWGRTENQEASNVKMKVEVPLVNFETCYDHYQSIGLLLHKKNQICAGGVTGEDSCTGDSGGPLMVEKDGTWYAEGIVSFGVGCGKKGWPGVYTNVPQYVTWIKNTINRKLENQKIKTQSRNRRKRVNPEG